MYTTTYTYVYHINSDEIPDFLARVNLISSHGERITCEDNTFAPRFVVLLHISRCFKTVWHFIEVYIINRTEQRSNKL